MMEEILARLAAENNLRKLPDIRPEGKYIVVGERRYLNLSSNDYLGITTAAWYRGWLEEAVQSPDFLLSNPSSRLITGNGADYTRLETTLSNLYNGRPSLVLGSGYLVNSGVLPALTTKNDLILADKFVHASLIDGLRLSEATWQRFHHNDPEHLERLLEKYANRYDRVWVVTESVFSMDGDKAPLAEIVALKEKYGFRLYVDEAHAFGVCGPNGKGVLAELGLVDQADILVATMGKAIASQGAFIITDAVTREVLVNRMRPLIFSTALPPISLRWSEEVIRRLPQLNAEREHLRRLSGMLNEAIGGQNGNKSLATAHWDDTASDTKVMASVMTGTSGTHIIPLMAGENRQAIEMSERFREAGYWTMPIRYPTVPKGSARVRISLTAALTTEEVENFTETWKNIG